MKILRERVYHEDREYYASYRLADHPGCGYSFPCDEQGNVLPLEYPEALRNLKFCLAGVDD